jgi:protein O-mannosyl-transferase
MPRKRKTKRNRSNSQIPALSFASLQQFCVSHPIVPFAILSACLMLLIYRNILWAPFVYDDQDQIQTNSLLLSWRSLITHYFGATQPFSSAFRGAGGSSYRPLFWLSLGLDRHLFDLNVLGFHLTNLLLHWANGLLTFTLLRRLGAWQLVAAITALIWLALPINSEAVAWISGRAYCLLTFFILLSLLFAERYLRKGTRLSLLWYFLAHIGALLSHEAGILVLPFVFLMICLIRRKACVGMSAATAGTSARATSLVVSRRIGTLGSLAGALSPAYLVLRAGIFNSSVSPHSWSLLPVGATLANYVAWILFPLHMSIERSTETPPNTLSLITIGGWCGLLLLILAILLLRNRMPEVSAGLAWMLLALLPFSGIVFIYQGMAERYDYLASVGLVLAIVYLCSKIRGNTKYFATAVVTLWALWGVWRLNSRLLDWSSETSLYASSLKTDPDSPILLLNLGSTLGDAGHLGDGLFLITRAISLKPDYAIAYRAQGNIYLRLGAFKQAKASYERALALQPDDVKAVTNLGDTYVRLKDLSAAEREFRRAITLAPKTINLYCNLGIVLFNQGKSDEALQQLLTALKLNPSDPNPYYFLGFVEEQMGARESAMQMYGKALQLQPGYSQARLGLDRLQHQQ